VLVGDLANKLQRVVVHNLQLSFVGRWICGHCNANKLICCSPVGALALGGGKYLWQQPGASVVDKRRLSNRCDGLAPGNTSCH